MNLVVGSGPAGVACALALLERGRPVTMLDAGIDLESDNKERAERLGSVPPSDWRPDDVSAWRLSPPDGNAVPVKRVHGSDFFQRAPAEAPALRQSGALALRSYAKGGLSRAWGATFVPFPEEELSRWPAEARNLAPHYEAVLRYVPAAGLSGDPLSLSPQADLLWRRMSEARASLSRAGLTFSRSVLAVHTAGPKGCRYCGGCLRGCPYGSIYSAADTLETLRGREGFTYVSGVVVRRCGETGDKVFVEGRRAGGGLFRQEGERLFLAAGAVSTSQILMESLPSAGDAVTLKSSQAFWIPLWMDKAPRDVEGAAAHALSQLFLTWRDASVASRPIQLQIYTHSDVLAEGLDRSVAGPFLRALPVARRAALRRFAVMQVLLHSDDSDELSMTVRRDSGEASFILDGRLSGAVRRRARRVASSLWKHRGFLGAAPVGLFSRLSAPGQSFHTGASFPMSSAPGPRSSDALGRPGGFRRIHAVDASVFPALPAPPPTFTAMANARRIVHDVP